MQNGKIFLPITINNNNCVYIYSNDVIRVYDTRNTNTYVNYTDYYINNHYITNTGTRYIGQTFDYNCISTSTFTTDVYYRNDLPQILFIFIVFFFIMIFLPLKLFSRWCRRL